MEIIRVQDVRDYLEEGRKDNGKLTQEDLDYMVDRLVDAIENEEHYWGLPYDDIFDVGVEDLLDAAGGKSYRHGITCIQRPLYRLGQIWRGFDDEDDEED